jgi:hypothetical protein
MSFKRIFILILIIQLLNGCKDKVTKIDRINSQSNGTSISKDYPLKIDWKFITSDSIKNKIGTEPNISEYTVIVYFNGACSICIVACTDWIKKMERLKTNKNIKYLFIAKSPDLFLSEYYMDEFNVKFETNEYLLLDKNENFVKYNSLIGIKDNDVLLLDNYYTVITVGNPFESKDIFDVYLKKGVFSK